MIILTTPYATEATIDFPMLIKDSGNLAASSDWTPATGDCKISRDGGNVANTTYLPTAIGGTGSVGWKLTLTADELTTSRVFVQIVDQSDPKAVEDQTILLYTHGHASAFYVFDFSSAYNITPLSSTVSSGEVSETDVTVYVSTASPSLVWTITDSSGTAVNLSGATVQLQVLKYDGSSLFTSSGTVSGGSNNIVTCTYTTTNTATGGAYRYELRRTDSGNERVLARGDFLIAEKQRE